MDISNLNALKVADLKQLLKARGLSLVGNKSDLIMRLESSVLNDGIVGSAESKSIDKEIDEDAILAGDDESFSKSEDALLHSEDLLLGDAGLVSPITVTPPAIGSTKPAVTKPTAQPESSAPKPAATATNMAFATKQFANIKTILTADEKKQVRAEKFADPKLKNRAERFGIHSETAAPIAENAKILSRAQRFGEVVSTKAKVIEENERINRRKERFGFVESTSNGSKSNTSSKPVVTNSIVDEKIQKRQARFGVVEEGEKKKNSTAPFLGNKRRRFAV